jgi:hypothetical protein
MAVLIATAAALLGFALLVAEIQEQTMRRRLRPADHAKVAAFLASRPAPSSSPPAASPAPPAA